MHDLFFTALQLFNLSSECTTTDLTRLVGFDLTTALTMAPAGKSGPGRNSMSLVHLGRRMVNHIDDRAMTSARL